MEQAVKQITGYPVSCPEATSFKRTWDFVRLIYHAVESRFPTILIFSYKGRDPHKKKPKDILHAGALTGHTFLKHSWLSYAITGYAPHLSKNTPYLPSVLWCDNFVFQDDNFGPFYLLPLQSLAVQKDFFYSQVADRSVTPISAKTIWPFRLFRSLYRPSFALILYPEEIGNFKDVLKIEQYAYRRLDDLISYMKKSPISLDWYSKLIEPYHNYNQIILRTFGVSKKVFLDSFLQYTFEEKNKVYEWLKECLSDFLWITEISLPETFWIKEKKIGEIITNPRIFRDNPEDAVVFVKLPKWAIKFEGSNFVMHPCDDPFDYKYDLITPSFPCFKNIFDLKSTQKLVIHR